MTELLQQARDLLGRFPLIDGHNDLPWALREQAGGDPDRVRLDPLGAAHTDLPRLAAGRVGAQFWSVYVPAWLAGGDFDGTVDVTVGLEDVSAYPALFAELLRRGWTEPDCAALAGGNLLRALRAAEASAARAAR